MLHKFFLLLFFQLIFYLGFKYKFSFILLWKSGLILMAHVLTKEEKYSLFLFGIFSTKRLFFLCPTFIFTLDPITLNSRCDPFVLPFFRILKYFNIENTCNFLLLLLLIFYVKRIFFLKFILFSLFIFCWFLKYLLY